MTLNITSKRNQHHLASDLKPSNVPDMSPESERMTDDKRLNHIQVHVEVCIKPECTSDPGAIEVRVYGYIRDSTAVFRSGILQFNDDPLLQELIQYAYVALPDSIECVPFWSAQLAIHIFQLNQDPVAEEMTDNDEDVVACQIHSLPCTEFDQIWENLLFQSDIKQRLLNYASTAMRFADLKVNPKIMCLNRMVLLHGPPGSGKTSLCAGLAQKLSIRLSSRFPHCQFVSINAHSLFSKWFSESGKLVLKLFQKIHDLVSDSSSLVILLLDEVESLAAARQAALSGSEPSDSIRAVNALLTQLDLLRSYPNVFICCTSNLVEAIDPAFLDRADMSLHIDSPSESARYEILRSCLVELIRIGILKVDGSQILPYNLAAADQDPVSNRLLALSKTLAGASGRRLRRLPVEAYSLHLNRMGADISDFIQSMSAAINDPALSIGGKHDRSHSVSVLSDSAQDSLPSRI